MVMTKRLQHRPDEAVRGDGDVHCSEVGDVSKVQRREVYSALATLHGLCGNCSCIVARLPVDDIRLI